MKRRLFIQACPPAFATALWGCGGGGAAEAVGAVTTPIDVPVDPANLEAKKVRGSTPPPTPAPTQAPAAAPAPSGPPDVAMWGDSMTEAYAQRMGSQFPSGRQLFNGGIIGQTSSQIRSRFMADSLRRSWITVIWAGHNDWLYQGSLQNIRDMVDALVSSGNERFIVLTNAPWANSQYHMGVDRAQVEQFNSAIVAAFPGKSLDINAALRDGSTGSAEDNADLAAGLTPRSLRWPNDPIHLNERGQDIVGAAVGKFIVAKGW